MPTTRRSARTAKPSDAKDKSAPATEPTPEPTRGNAAGRAGATADKHDGVIDPPPPPQPSPPPPTPPAQLNIPNPELPDPPPQAPSSPPLIPREVDPSPPATAPVQPNTMSTPPSQPDPTFDDLDSDSEYETTTHYITLSLPITLPSTLPSSNPHHNNLPPTPSIPTPPPAPPSRLQLSGFDTPNPLLSFRNKLYTGTHSLGLGTEVHLVHSGGVEEGGVLESRKKATAYGDSSVASAYLGRQRRKPRSTRDGERKDAGGEDDAEDDGGEGEEGEEEEIIAVVTEPSRIAFTPVSVVAKEWSFREQQSAKEGFLRRLEALQVKKGEREEFQMPATDGRGAEVVGPEKEVVAAGRQEGEERPVVVGGYFARNSEAGEHKRVVEEDDVVMVDT